MADAANALISKVHTLAHTHTLTHAPKVGYPLSSVRVFPIIKQSPNTELDTPPLESIESNRPNHIELNRNGELGSSLGKLPARGTLHFTRISPAGVSRCPLTIGGHTLCYFFFVSHVGTNQFMPGQRLNNFCFCFGFRFWFSLCN